MSDDVRTRYIMVCLALVSLILGFVASVSVSLLVRPFAPSDVIVVFAYIFGSISCAAVILRYTWENSDQSSKGFDFFLRRWLSILGLVAAAFAAILLAFKLLT